MATIAHDDSDAVVIIGSGAGGGTLAHELTRRGIRVVLLEAGTRQSLQSFSQNPGEAFGQLTWLDPRTTSGTHTVLQDYPTLPSWTAMTVGGTTVHWTAVALRVQASETRARTVYGAVDGASLIDWPVDYKELEHYYDLAEKRMVVTRTHGNPGLPASAHFKVMYHGARRIGYKRVHTGHLAINSQPADGRGMCIQQGFCVQGCKTGAKWSTLYTEIPKAEATGHLDLRSGCRATRIEHGADGRANAVVYRDKDGVEQRQKARIVCVACNSIETARLLLLSDSAKFPHGLANSTDQVGRNYTRHTAGFIWGAFEKPVHFWRGTTLAGIVEDEIPHNPKRGFAGGYHLELAALDLPSLPLAGFPSTLWGRDFGYMMDHYDRLAGMLINGEDMPMATNRVTLSSTVRGRFGLPVGHLHLDEHPNDAAMRAHAQRQGRAIYDAVGALRTAVSRQTPAAHNMGTARMSLRPEDGVVNGHGRAHDVPNLFVSDGSALSTAGSANPTLTIVALALRQADFIAKEMSARNL